MSETLKIENALNPVTALAFLELEHLLVISGEGQGIKIFEHQTGSLLCTQRIFESEVIHGIACTICKNGNHRDRAHLLLWGGRSFSLVDLSSLEPNGPPYLGFNIALAEVRTSDWILDITFNPCTNEADHRFSVSFEAAMITAHNKLRRLRFPNDAPFEIQDGATSETAALSSGDHVDSRLDALLYSAHIGWSREDHAKGRILVAAGTVFGEVHLCSSEYDNLKLGALQLLYTFTGHHGSVFGVHIGGIVDLMNGSVTRLLASCSDDRTIRIWDISEMKPHDPVNTSTRCLATVMGHASRIWGLRSLYGLDGIPQVLSLGEDGTAQVWLLEPASKQRRSKKTPSNGPLNLVHDTDYHYHSGKHIWASAILDKEDGSSLIATGGADGRIVSCHRSLPYFEASTTTATSHCTMSQVVEKHEEVPTCAKATTKKKAIFLALQGPWRFSRSLQSAIPTYPSGMLEGTASIEGRPAEDPNFDDEWLYSEKGDFVTDRGLTMKATRQYVYRYHQQTDELTAWFVKTEGQGLVDYLFHRLDFTDESVSGREGKTILKAKGHHLCLNDNYVAEYSFEFMGQRIEEWGVTYTVKGPEKDYVANATYSTPSPGSAWTHFNGTSNYVAATNGTMNHGLEKTDAFKSYAWISNTKFLTTTDQGYVLIGEPNVRCTNNENGQASATVTWESISQISDLISSSLVTSVPSLGIAFLMGSNGKVFRYKSRTNLINFELAGQQKPAYLKAQEVHALAGEDETKNYGNWDLVFDIGHDSKSQSWMSLITTSHASDTVVVSFHASDDDEILCNHDQFSIYLPRAFVVTSSCLLSNATLVILGSRNGNLLIYDPLRKLCPAGSSSVESSFVGVHGREAITDIQIVPDRRTNPPHGVSWIVTTGRDGRFAVHRINFSEVVGRDRKFELETCHESMLPFGPNIEDAHFDKTSLDLFLWGFHSRRFVVWNETTKTMVMSIECGGAHRHWAYSPPDDGKGGGSFVWTKASVCKVHKQTEASHRVLQPGGHGREIKAIAIAPNGELSSDDSLPPLIATGAEDTTIRLFNYELASGYRCISTITKHTTGIQKLHFSGTYGQYLFSAAGCEEFFIFRIMQVPRLEIGITCKLLCPNVTPDKDLRIMDFAILDIQSPASQAKEGDASHQLIAMIYSDSSVRIFAFSNVQHREYSLTLLLEGSYGAKCLTQVVFIDLGLEKYLCTASSDGHLAFWPLKNVLADHGFHQRKGLSIGFDPNLQSETRSNSLLWQMRVQVHQNSIKGLVHVEISPNNSLLMTCGDDQSIALTHVTAPDAELMGHDPTFAVLSLPNAHASAVTGLTYIGSEIKEDQTKYRFGTVGNDQQLKIWEVIDSTQKEGIERFRLKNKIQVHTSIADASAISTFDARATEPVRLCVAGIGLETWQIEGEQLVLYRK